MGKPAIHFKGSGWYITDSKKSSDAKSGANGTSKESNGAGKETAGAESNKEKASGETKVESAAASGAKPASELAKSTAD
jgi:hypothetical protein